MMKYMKRWTVLALLFIVCNPAFAQYNPASVYVPDYIKSIKANSELDRSKGSVVLLPFRFKNQFKQSHPLNTLGVSLQKLGGPHIQDTVSTKYVSEDADGWRYFALQAWVVPGKYRVVNVFGMTVPSIVTGRVLLATDIEFEVTDTNKLIYLGQSDLMNVRRTTLADTSTGFATPLVDQSVTGFSGGTVTIQLQKEAPSDWSKKYALLDSFSLLKDYEMKEGGFSKYVLTGSGRHEKPKSFTMNDPQANAKINPLVIPIPTGYADVGDADKFLATFNNPSLVGKYKAWLQKKYTRAFVVTKDGKHAFEESSNSPFDSPILKAWNDCQQQHADSCAFYAIDSEVLWPATVAK